MPLRVGRTLTAVLLAMLALAGCSSSDDETPTSAAPPPAATDLISAAAAAMKAVTSAHFVIGVTGTLPDLTVQSAEGDLSTAGDAQGTANIKQAGQLIEAEFVIVDKDLYLKAGTGGFTKLPAALASQVYDPTAILDPDTGVAKVLTSATGLTTATQVGDRWAVTGTVPQAVAASLTPGITTDVAATFSIDQQTSRVGGVSFAVIGSDQQPATVTLALSDFDKQLSITAPSGS